MGLRFSGQDLMSSVGPNEPDAAASVLAGRGVPRGGLFGGGKEQKDPVGPSKSLIELWQQSQAAQQAIMEALATAKKR